MYEGLHYPIRLPSRVMRRELSLACCLVPGAEIFVRFEQAYPDELFAEMEAPGRLFFTVGVLPVVSFLVRDFWNFMALDSMGRMFHDPALLDRAGEARDLTCLFPYEDGEPSLFNVVTCCVFNTFNFPDSWPSA